MFIYWRVVLYIYFDFLFITSHTIEIMKFSYDYISISYHILPISIECYREIIFNVANIRVFLIHDNRNFFLILSVLAYFSLSIYNRLFMISFLCLFLSLPLSAPLSCYVNIFCANTKVRTFIFSSSFENRSILFSSNRKLRTQVM